MAIGDPISAGIGSYDPSVNYFAQPQTRGAGLLGSGSLNIATVPGQSKMDALNALRERLGRRAIGEDRSVPLDAGIGTRLFSIAPTGMAKGPAKQQDMTVGDFNIARKLAALSSPNIMTQTTAALQDDPSAFEAGLIDPLDLPNTYVGDDIPSDLVLGGGTDDMGSGVPLGGSYLEGEGITGTGTKTGTGTTDAEAEAFRQAEQKRASMQGMQGIGSTSAEDEKLSPYEKALSDAMQEVEESFSGEKKPRKTIEDYKKDFTDATGIDTSGKVDKSQALMAFGLALMQNKAGKGFNVGSILSEVGAAGEKALPELSKAKSEARAAQLAGGKYALNQAAADSAAEAALAKEKRAALASIQTNILDFKQKQLLNAQKHEFNMQEKNAEFRKDQIIAHIEAGGKANKITNPWEITPISGMEKNVKIRKAWSQAQGKDIFVDGDAAAESVAIAYGNANQAAQSIDDLEEIILQIGDNTGSPATDVLLGKADDIAVALGFGKNIMTKPIEVDGEKIEGISAQSTAQAIQDRMIAQYKRFLTQETGNGISEGDVQRIKDLLGEITALTNPQEKLMRLNELRKIFDSPRQQIASVMSQLADPDNYINEKEHAKALKVLQDSTTVSYTHLTLPTIYSV